MSAATGSANLKEIPLFQGLDDSQIETIQQRVRRHHYASGTYIITAETPGESVYIVLSGTVKIKADQADGKEVIIAILGAGSIVGEMSVLDCAGRSADVLTLEESNLLWMDRGTFNELVDTLPAVSRNLLQILTRRLRLTTEQIQALCTLDVYGMVARQLIAFADLYGETSSDGVVIPLRLTQSDIAGLVGASRERVNQVFVALRDSRLISVDGSYRITIHNDEKLREIVRQR